MTIDEAIRALGVGQWKRRPELLKWPPDVFAICASLIDDSGAYLQAVCEHAGNDLGLSASAWSADIKQIAESWGEDVTRAPTAVRRLWNSLLAHADTPVPQIGQHSDLWTALLRLACIADEACLGVGDLGQLFRVPETDWASHVKYQGLSQLLEHTAPYEKGTDTSKASVPSLCRLVDPSVAIVVPKMLTPNRGLTIRSLSHYLALYRRPRVTPIPVIRDCRPPRNARGPLPRRTYNLLLLPWPERIRPRQFGPMGNHSGLIDRFVPGHNMFGFKHDHPEKLRTKVDALASAAREEVGDLDCIVFPEMAMSQEAFDQAFPEDGDIPGEANFLMAGTFEPATDDALARNQAVIRMRFENHDQAQKVTYVQSKHHRWALDLQQIQNYGLTSRLDPNQTWWEGIHIGPRELHFFELDTDLLMSVLICEDLARPDPAGELIRAVGPNLVIALLQDGPQLAARWACRYAGSLADDPGSSVLTLTSKGLAQLSRPPDCSTDNAGIVALWRDPFSGVRELRLPDGCVALVVTLYERERTEVTIDGRTDRAQCGCLVLGDYMGLTPDGSPTPL